MLLALLLAQAVLTERLDSTVEGRVEHQIVMQPGSAADLRLSCKTERECPECVTTCPTDVTGDGITGGPDLNLLMQHYGTPCSEGP